MDDDTVILAATAAQALGLASNPIPAVLAARDKYRQRVVLAEHGVPVPEFALHRIEEDPEAVARQAAYPCVLKPLRLSASRGVIRADDPAGFVAAFRRLKAILGQPDVAACGEPARQFLVERFVPGPEVALEGLLVGGRLHVLAVFDKPDPLNGPFFEETIYITPSRLPGEAQTLIEECAARSARALSLVEGPVHAELRYHSGGPWLIELAARPIGGRCSAALRFERGMSLEELILRHALGMEIPSFEREREASGVMMIPIPRAGVLRDVQGLVEARAVPGIEEIAITAHPGEELVPLPEGSRYLGFVFARGASPEQVEAALREAQRRVAFIIDSDP